MPEPDSPRLIPIEDRKLELIAARHTARVRRLYGISETAQPEPAILPVFLTVDDVIGLIAYGRTKALDGPAPGAPPMFERWRSHVTGLPSDDRQYPLVQQMRLVLARVRWWQSSKRRRSSPVSCPIRPLDRISRGHVRWIIRRHKKPAVETIALLRADVRKLNAALSAHEIAIESAIAALCAEIAAEHIVAWGRRGVWSNRRYTSGIHERIPPEFFASPNNTILGDGWATCGWDVSVQHWADWKGPDWGDVRFKRDDVLRLIDRHFGPRSIQFSGGYISPLFVTDEEKRIVELSEPYILIYEGELYDSMRMLPILEWIVTSERPFLFIGEGMNSSLLKLIVLNRQRGAMKVAAVRVRGSNEERRSILQNIADFTGGFVLNDDLGIEIEQLTIRELGTANNAIVERGQTTLYGGGGRTVSQRDLVPVAQGPAEAFVHNVVADPNSRRYPSGMTWVEKECDGRLREALSSAERDEAVDGSRADTNRTEDPIRPRARQPPVANAALEKWYVERRGLWPIDRKHPSQDEDLVDARQQFPDHNVTRPAIRAMRAKHAPASWTAHGRPKLAQK